MCIILCLLRMGTGPSRLPTPEEQGIGAREAAEEVVLPEGTRYGLRLTDGGPAVFYDEGTRLKEYICSFGFKEYWNFFRRGNLIPCMGGSLRELVSRLL